MPIDSNGVVRYVHILEKYNNYTLRRLNKCFTEKVAIIKDETLKMDTELLYLIGTILGCSSSVTVKDSLKKHFLNESCGICPRNQQICNRDCEKLEGNIFRVSGCFKLNRLNLRLSWISFCLPSFYRAPPLATARYGRRPHPKLNITVSLQCFFSSLLPQSLSIPVSQISFFRHLKAENLKKIKKTIHFALIQAQMPQRYHLFPTAS